jgi:hypothetical protein
MRSTFIRPCCMPQVVLDADEGEAWASDTRVSIALWRAESLSGEQHPAACSAGSLHMCRYGGVQESSAVG